MGRISDLSAAPVIKEYAQGAAQAAIAPVADFLSPTVPVSTQTGKYKIYTAKNRFKLPDTRRPSGGRAVEVGWDASDGTFDCTPHAVDVPIDVLEQIESASSGEDAMKEAADLAAEIGGLSHEKNVIDTAAAALTATAVTWNGSVDPINALDGYALTILKAAKYGSLMGVRILFGADAFKGLKNHPLIRNRFVVGGDAKKGPLPLAAINENEIGKLLIGTPQTRVSFMVYDSAKEGVAENIEFLLGSKILIFACKDQPTRRDPSFMKTFRLRNRWMLPGVYTRDDGRAEVAKFDWSEDAKVTNSAAAVLLNVSFG